MTRTLRFSLATALIAATATTASADLIISEIVDATLPGGLPKFVEITNTGGSAVNLGDYSIGNINNGGVELGGGASTALSGQLGACESYVIAYEFEPDPGVVSMFEQVYGFLPDQWLGTFINGDDVVVLFLGLATGDGSDATIVDIYGVIGVDGSGEVWEYTDGYSFRLGTIAAANPTFDAAEWFIGGLNSLETGDDLTELPLILARLHATGSDGREELEPGEVALPVDSIDRFRGPPPSWGPLLRSSDD
jgi:hypothetical protein